MFFEEKIINIKSTDRVLEIGPGGDPYWRSDVLLEKKFNTPVEYAEQRGFTEELKTDKVVVYYDGGTFPFSDNEFDYVICSHVLEHVDDVDSFLSEVSRVGRAGYLEYPTIYYEYLYNFSVHKNILLNRDGHINWLKKDDTNLDDFSAVSNFFRRTLQLGYDHIIVYLRSYFVEGFEWTGKVVGRQVHEIGDVCFDENNNFPVICKNKYHPLIIKARYTCKKILSRNFRKFKYKFEKKLHAKSNN